MEKQPLLRIRNRDKNNWTIERYQAGGIVSRGKYKGQEIEAKWDEINPVGYYPTLKDAAHRLMDEELRRDWPANGWTGEILQGLIEAAETRVLAAVADASNVFQEQLKEKA